MSTEEYVFEARPRRAGKSVMQEKLMNALLDQGKTVLVCSLAGDTLRKRHKRSGFTLITPVPRKK